MGASRTACRLPHLSPSLSLSRSLSLARSLSLSIALSLPSRGVQATLIDGQTNRSTSGIVSTARFDDEGGGPQAGPSNPRRARIGIRPEAGPYWNPSRGGPVLEARGQDLCREDGGRREKHRLPAGRDAPVQRAQRHLCRGTSLIRNRPPVGPYSRPMHRALW